MSRYLFDGLPPNVVTYIKVQLRRIYTTGLFDGQEREDLIQELVLFYFELIRQRCNLTDDYLFISIKTKAQKIIRTRLREMQAGFFYKESLNNMSEEEGFELASNLSLADLENLITINEIKSLLNDKQRKFIDLVLEGEKVLDAIAKIHVSKNVLDDIRSKLKRKNEKK